MADKQDKRIRLVLTSDERRALRVKASQSDMSMSAFVRDIVLKTIKEINDDPKPPPTKDRSV